MSKLTKTEQAKVTRFAVDWMLRELIERQRFDFAELRAAILAKWPGAEFNWLPVVRNPMQSLINDGTMIRDTSDIRGPELYKRGPTWSTK